MQQLSAVRLLLTEACEPLIRIAGWLGCMVGRNRSSTEMRLRGLLLGGRTSNWRIGRYVQFCGNPSRFNFGVGVVLYGNSYLDANGPLGRMQIGTNSHVDQFCVLYGQGGLSIGKDCALASAVVIYTQSNEDSRQDRSPVVTQPTKYAAVVLEDGIWVGAKVCILPGVVVGQGSILGAGAVVLKNVPANVIAYGVPAQVKGERRAQGGQAARS